MINLKHYLTRLIIPLFLSQALSLQARTTAQSPIAIAIATSHSTTAPPTVSCNSLAGHTRGVQQRLLQYSHLVPGRQCFVLSANPTEDLDQLINRLPENTVILLSSKTDPAVTTPSPAISPAPDKTPVEYFIGSEIRLKDGQVIIGAADDGFDIVIRDRPGFTDKHLIKVGTTDNFQFGETRDSHIRHITFRPTRENKYLSIDSIVFSECYNRKLILEENVFHLPVKAALDFDCKQSLDASSDATRPGPGLLFANNTLIGTSFKSLTKTLVPEKGISINLPAIRHQEKRLVVADNTFRGKMAEAGVFRLGPESRMEIFKNTVDITNYGRIGRPAVRKGGFDLIGHTDINAKPPLFNLAGNQIRVTATAVTVNGQLELVLVCNHLQGFNSWWQPQPQFLLKSIPATFEEIMEKCQNVPGSNVIVPTPSTSSQLANTWTGTKYSSDTACTGLVNFEGLFFFEKDHCQTVTPQSTSSTHPYTKKSFDINTAPYSSSRAKELIAATVVLSALALLCIK
ncbi:hypothetical protein [Endozoicomonas sp. SESOKO4]|uniref:hypothetical protein n=1 Tax=Endozoicomonas sp. SESOKO4 TaxID=2828745 RepID=UPI0021498D99|nr:hypothetical protein [Endozoicomonas sp. SESOKO4]